MNLFHELVVGNASAVTAIVEASRDSDDPAILVAASLFSPDAERLLARAQALAETTRDRHLVDHPESILAAWIADVSQQQTSDKERP